MMQVSTYAVRVLAAISMLSACSQPTQAGHASEFDTSSSAPARTPKDAEADRAMDAAVSATRDAGKQRAPTVDAGETNAATAPGGSLADGAAQRERLVLPELWARVDQADDPFDDSPAMVQCEWGATMAESLASEPAFSVDTGLCNYLTVRQPTLSAVAAGETLKVRLWHFELSAPEPAQAHAAVLVDGIAILDEHISIPAPGGLLARQVRVTRAIAAGAPVLFHLHNHGENSWALVEVSRAAESMPD